LAFADGDLSARVRALLAPRSKPSTWPGRAVACGALVLPLLLLASHDRIHHCLETLLGALS
jgi:hypothetical protein